MSETLTLEGYIFRDNETSMSRRNTVFGVRATRLKHRVETRYSVSFSKLPGLCNVTAEIMYETSSVVAAIELDLLGCRMEPIYLSLLMSFIHIRSILKPGKERSPYL